MNYEELNWPSLPDNIETLLLEFCRSEPAENATNLYKDLPKQAFFQFNAPDYLVEWVEKNIPIPIGDNVVKLQVWRDVDYVKRHIDRIRHFSYNYLLMEHQGITRWFEDEEIVDSVRYEYKKWYKHVGGEKYHDVIDVNKLRAAVTIFKEIEPRTDIPSSLWDDKKTK